MTPEIAKLRLITVGTEGAENCKSSSFILKSCLENLTRDIDTISTGFPEHLEAVRGRCDARGFIQQSLNKISSRHPNWDLRARKNPISGVEDVVLVLDSESVKNTVSDPLLEKDILELGQKNRGWCVDIVDRNDERPVLSFGF